MSIIIWASAALAPFAQGSPPRAFLLRSDSCLTVGSASASRFMMLDMRECERMECEKQHQWPQIGRIRCNGSEQERSLFHALRCECYRDLCIRMAQPCDSAHLVSSRRTPQRGSSCVRSWLGVRPVWCQLTGRRALAHLLAHLGVARQASDTNLDDHLGE